MLKKRVLVVDDTPLYRLPICMALEAEGYRAVCAADGREARKLIDTNLRPFDLMIVDCVMPEIDGLTFLKAARGHPSYRQVPAIMLTEVADRAVVLQSFALGARDYVLKSCFSLPELLEKVHAQLYPEPPTTAPTTAQAAPAVPETPATAVLHGVRKFVDRHPLAQAVQRVLSLTSTEDTDGAALAYAVNAEPLLAARVLKLANSSTYSRPCKKISTLGEAIAVVGFAAIRSIALGAYFCAMGATGSSTCSQTRRSVHVYAIGRIMQRLLEKRELGALGHLTGLCHELPETVLLVTFPELYRRAADRACAVQESFATALQRECGISYLQLASEVFEGLALPKDLIEAVSHAAGHGPPASDTARSLAQALLIAHSFAHGHGYTSPTESPCRTVETGYIEQLIARSSFDVAIDDEFHEDVRVAKGLFSAAF